ncbi:MAG TPA: hypothetical protein VF138_06600 [Caulobacteraceae bacterium]
MIRQIAVAASVALMAFAGQAAAGQKAQLSSVGGSVLVSQNGRYVPVTKSTVLRAGDRVLSLGGDAKLQYADGCVADVAAGSMTTLGACGEAKVVRAQYGEGAPANAAWERRGDFYVWVVFGVVTFTVLAAAWNNDEDPHSP